MLSVGSLNIHNRYYVSKLDCGVPGDVRRDGGADVGGLRKQHSRLNWVVVRRPPLVPKWVGAELVAFTSCVQRRGARVDSWFKATTGVKQDTRRDKR